MSPLSDALSLMDPEPVAGPGRVAPGLDPLGAAAIESLVKRYGSPLFLVDLARIRAQYRCLRAALPSVELHYALKPLPVAGVVRALLAEGASFDLATNGEVALVERCGVPPARCIHTHPIKRDSDIRTAVDYGVTVFVVDNPDELRKFAKYRRRAAVLIRVSFRNPGAVCDLSKKFGCRPEAVAALLDLAEALNVPVQGLSFHIGSQPTDPSMHVRAIEVCRDLIVAARERGHVLTTLDIGGGFPVAYAAAAGPSIEEYCAPIRAALATLPVGAAGHGATGEAGIRVIAEPGRFIAAPAAVAVSTVMGRALRDEQWWYYLDDGLYGSYSGQIYDHATYPVEALRAMGPTQSSVLAGPTCDSIDVIRENVDLPLLDVGDLVVGRSMGAYTWASASEFNFFPRATVLSLEDGQVVVERATR